MTCQQSNGRLLNVDLCYFTFYVVGLTVKAVDKLVDYFQKYFGRWQHELELLGYR